MKYLRKRWLEENKEHRLAYMKTYNRNRKLSQYGLTVDTFNQMLEKQNNQCAICFTNTPTTKGWCVDHCHTTNKVRGIVCDHCNLMLGYAKDNPNTLANAIKYLEQS